MLVLTRKSEEKIIIGKNKNVVITVLRVQGDKVSLGFEAAPDIPICREEVFAAPQTSCPEQELQEADTQHLAGSTQGS